MDTREVFIIELRGRAPGEPSLWKPERGGYTDALLFAGAYPQDEAMEVVRGNTRGDACSSVLSMMATRGATFDGNYAEPIEFGALDFPAGTIGALIVQEIRDAKNEAALQRSIAADAVERQAEAEEIAEHVKVGLNEAEVYAAKLGEQISQLERERHDLVAEEANVRSELALMKKSAAHREELAAQAVATAEEAGRLMNDHRKIASDAVDAEVATAERLVEAAEEIRELQAQVDLLAEERDAAVAMLDAERDSLSELLGCEPPQIIAAVGGLIERCKIYRDACDPNEIADLRKLGATLIGGRHRFDAIKTAMRNAGDRDAGVRIKIIDVITANGTVCASQLARAMEAIEDIGENEAARHLRALHRDGVLELDVRERYYYSMADVPGATLTAEEIKSIASELHRIADAPSVVYIAGPYRGSAPFCVRRNISNAAEFALLVWSEGLIALCPHLNSAHFEGVASDRAFLDGTLELMRRCDAIYMTAGWENSEGSRAELEEAKRLGKVIITSREELHAAIADGRLRRVGGAS